MHSLNLHYTAFNKLCNLVPTLCIVCKRQCHGAYSLCPECEAQLPAIGSHCQRCGLPFPERQLQQARCGNCLGKEFPVQQCHALFHYSSPINKLLSSFKYRARLDIGRSLGCLLAHKMSSVYSKKTAPDLLIPVPMHPRRYFQRGFNQSWELTRFCGDMTGFKTCANLVKKTRHTESQTSLSSHKKREANLHKAFAINGRMALDNVSKITIIDDTVTTMATVSALARLLRSHGIPEVEVWCIARTSIR